MIENEKDNLSAVQKIIVDAGYTGEKFDSKIKTIINANVEVIKRNELHSFVVLSKRWVVERSFAWLEKCRRLLKSLHFDYIFNSVGVDIETYDIYSNIERTKINEKEFIRYSESEFKVLVTTSWSVMFSNLCNLQK